MNSPFAQYETIVNTNWRRPSWSGLRSAVRKISMTASAIISTDSTNSSPLMTSMQVLDADAAAPHNDVCDYSYKTAKRLHGTWRESFTAAIPSFHWCFRENEN